MADAKISNLPVSTLPLAGTEVLPLVQSGVTKKASVENVLTSVQPSGTANGVTFLNGSKVSTSGSALTFDGTNFGVGTATPSRKLTVFGADGVPFLNVNGYDAASFTSATLDLGGVTAAQWNTVRLFASGAERLKADATNVTVSTGNLVIGTAGKGIDFSADPAAAGMTSELLDDYEEGTWTPTQGAGLTVVGAFSSDGTYTKIGNQVTVVGRLLGATSIAAASGAIMCGGVPFTGASYGLGTASDNGANNGISLFVLAPSLYAANAIPATTPAIRFGATFFV